MPPRKKAEKTAEALAPKSVPNHLLRLFMDRVVRMADGPHQEAITNILNTRILDSLAMAEEMFTERNTVLFDEWAMECVGLAALSAWEPKAALRELRQMITSFLSPAGVPEAKLKAWLQKAEADVAALPVGYTPPDVPAEEPSNAPPPSPEPVEPEALTADDLAALDQDTRTMGELQRAYGEDRDLANQLLGQTQMAQAFGKFAQAISFTKLQVVKERKLYKALSGVPGKDREGKLIEDMGTWDGYCRALGMSKSKVEEDLLNLRTFGQEAMEALAKAGAGYRELRAMRALPEGEREAIAAEAARATTREELLDLLDEVQTRNAAKVEELEKKAAEQAADLEARDQLLKDKSARLEKKELELAKLKSLPPQENVRLKLEVEKQAVDDLNVKSIDAIAALNGLMTHVEEIMAADVSLHTRTYCEDTVRMFAETFTDLLARHGINVDFQGMAAPAWDKAAAKDDIKAGRTGA